MELGEALNLVGEILLIAARRMAAISRLVRKTQNGLSGNGPASVARVGAVNISGSGRFQGPQWVNPRPCRHASGASAFLELRHWP